MKWAEFKFNHKDSWWDLRGMSIVCFLAELSSLWGHCSWGRTAPTSAAGVRVRGANWLEWVKKPTYFLVTVVGSGKIQQPKENTRRGYSWRSSGKGKFSLFSTEESRRDTLSCCELGDVRMEGWRCWSHFAGGVIGRECDGRLCSPCRGSMRPTVWEAEGTIRMKRGSGHVA